MDIGERITTASAWGALASPVWLPMLADLSAGCAIVAPILGVAWLLLQLILKLRDEMRGR
jgi:hypothetical protein